MSRGGLRAYCIIIIFASPTERKTMNYINPSIKDLKQFGKDKQAEYLAGSPFPNIVFDDFFDEDIINKVADDFPDLSKRKDVIAYNTQDEKKLAAKGEANLSENAKLLTHYLNSEPFLEFLQELTGVKETLIPDPYLNGGGYHE